MVSQSIGQWMVDTSRGCQIMILVLSAGTCLYKRWHTKKTILQNSCQINITILDKLQITPLKFGSDWILHLEISEFEFLHPDVLEFKFYILKFWKFRV